MKREKAPSIIRAGLAIVATMMLAGVGLCRTASTGSPPSPPVSPRILYVSLDDPEQPYVRALAEGFREGLAAARRPVTVYREFFDQVRFGDRPTYAAEFRAWLRQKYRDRHLDLIVTAQQSTLQLFAQAPDNPWSHLPLVYQVLGDLTIDISRTHPTASGVIMENYVPLVLDVIKTILPDTHTIAAIQASSAAERARNDWYLPQIRQKGLQVLDLGGMRADQLVTRLGALPPGTVPLLFGFQRDAAGRTFGPGEAAALFSRAANQPLFTLVGNDARGGLVGGATPDFSVVGREAAAQALARLEGKPPTTLRIPVSRHTALIFDARELARWGIPESRLPPNSIVQFRPPSLWRDYRRTVVAALAVGIVQTLLILAVLVERRRAARTQSALGASYRQLQELSARLITAQDDERGRIARDLHDDIGQRIASLSMGLSQAKRMVPDATHPLRQELATLQQHVVAVATDLRHLSRDLHPGALEHLGLLETLRARCDDVRSESGVDARLDVSDAWRDVPGHIAVCLYRVAQEALRNTVQHAAARRVVVSLDRRSGDVSMRVADDGQGFDVRALSGESGLGLVSLAERIRMHGGALEIHARPSAGTTIAVTLPVRGPDGS